PVRDLPGRNTHSARSAPAIQGRRWHGLCRLRRALPAGRTQFRLVLAAPHLHALPWDAGARIPRSDSAGAETRGVPDASGERDRDRHEPDRDRCAGGAEAAIRGDTGAKSAPPLNHGRLNHMRMRIMKHHRELVQRRIAKAFRLDRFHRRQHVIAIVAGAAVALLDDAELLVKREAAGILHVAAVDDIGQRADARSRLVLDPHRAHHLAIDVGGLLAGAQVGDGVVAELALHAEGDAAAGAAAVEAEHEPGFFGRAAVIERIDAERRKNRRRAPDARRRAAPIPSRYSRSPAARSASRSRTPRGRSWMIPRQIWLREW